MTGRAERAYFYLCLLLGRLLRAGKYSSAEIVRRDGTCEVHKRRSFYAPLLVWCGSHLFKILDAGVHVLPQHEWEERERSIYRSVYGNSVRIDERGTLVLPCLPGETLAAVLDAIDLEAATRTRAIGHAVGALAAFHRLGHSHGDAMADNVLVHLESESARWFDFETVHDPGRSMLWRRADDLRALIATCLVRTPHSTRADTLALILEIYGDEDVVELLKTDFTPGFRRPLMFHLAQAPLSFESFMETHRLLEEHRRG